MWWVEGLGAGRVAGLHGDATHVIAAPEQDVAVFAPGQSPAVFHLAQQDEKAGKGGSGPI